MPQGWSAVAEVINHRMKALGWRQRDLAEKSKLSLTTIRELQTHTIERSRSPRTLQALSTTLGLHPGHLQAVLQGMRPPTLNERPINNDYVTTRLVQFERMIVGNNRRLEDMLAQLAVITDALEQNGALRAHL
ncbi:helix-turn-helix transcriptional regulator [Actinokineospora sp. NBRC 105648]|uniref:helix-turn-helix domain-containing protein n=1 Tax=Actinokineospora sp. NBRC 105648 TaxID=3032206 RepID=UPI0024A2C933|nr:helix-turn-helix transcriptional regulator [Actinokineospora sp. NBRC 105648]GLZ37622.1 hypothetical protein Acsp05_12470 [Actinokineospora sp. NBRC 105648]